MVGVPPHLDRHGLADGPFLVTHRSPVDREDERVQVAWRRRLLLAVGAGLTARVIRVDA